MLYPQTNEKRGLISLDGLWAFCLDDGTNNEKISNDFIARNKENISVPASYNDQKDELKYREHYGWAYYEKTFTVPEFFSSQRLVLRFDAVTHHAIVYINGKPAAEHRGGFLPFEIELTGLIKPGCPVLLQVAVDNRVSHSTLPVGNEDGTAFFGSDNAGVPSVEAAKVWRKKRNLPNFDFFNYAGINRSVRVYTTPADYIQDITIVPSVKGSDGYIDYSVKTSCAGDVSVTVYSREHEVVAEARGAEGRIRIENARLWNPWPEDPYLYTAEVRFRDDKYTQRFGIRTMRVDGHRFLINEKPFFFKGFGKHEDSAVHGRGFDLAYDVKDMSLIKWLGANSFRTSHYPYAEEMYDLADEEGIVIIDETPAVGIGAGDKTDPYKTFDIRSHHEDVIRDLIARDKNHPSVVMWSMANEPDTEHFPESARDYWTSLYEFTHSLDPQDRPVTFVCCQNNYERDLATREMDVVCINRYYGWYNLSGDMDAACYALNLELDFWQKIDKPLIMTEYGADTLPGFHLTAPEMFSEEFQVMYYDRINSEFDKRDFVCGEHPWNFADFNTIQGVYRADGNRKGLLTRDRRPKMSAHYFRKRWNSIPNFGYKG